TIIYHIIYFIKILFDKNVINFVYQYAFSTFRTINDENLAESMDEVLSDRKKEQEALAEQRAEEKAERELEQQRRDRIKNLKIHESSQIVFWLDEEEQENVFNDWSVFVGN